MKIGDLVTFKGRHCPSIAIERESGWEPPVRSPGSTSWIERNSVGIVVDAIQVSDVLPDVSCPISHATHLIVLVNGQFRYAGPEWFDD